MPSGCPRSGGIYAEELIKVAEHESQKAPMRDVRPSVYFYVKLSGINRSRSILLFVSASYAVVCIRDTNGYDLSLCMQPDHIFLLLLVRVTFDLYQITPGITVLRQGRSSLFNHDLHLQHSVAASQFKACHYFLFLVIFCFPRICLAFEYIFASYRTAARPYPDYGLCR